jgi:hypothetical protein
MTFGVTTISGLLAERQRLSVRKNHSGILYRKIHAEFLSLYSTRIVFAVTVGRLNNYIDVFVTPLGVVEEEDVVATSPLLVVRS